MNCFGSLRGLLIPTLAILVLDCQGVLGNICDDFCDSVRPSGSGRDSFRYYCLLASSPARLVDCVGLCNPCRRDGYCRGLGSATRWECPFIPALPGWAIALIVIGCIVGLFIIIGVCICVIMLVSRRNRAAQEPAQPVYLEEQYPTQPVYVDTQPVYAPET